MTDFDNIDWATISDTAAAAVAEVPDGWHLLFVEKAEYKAAKNGAPSLNMTCRIASSFRTPTGTDTSFINRMVWVYASPDMKYNFKVVQFVQCVLSFGIAPSEIGGMGVNDEQRLTEVASRIVGQYVWALARTATGKGTDRRFTNWNDFRKLSPAELQGVRAGAQVVNPPALLNASPLDGLQSATTAGPVAQTMGTPVGAQTMGAPAAQPMTMPELPTSMSQPSTAFTSTLPTLTDNTDEPVF